jgi:hypothetical protein
MAVGCKTGGRQKGTPNRRTVELAERLQALGCDPVGELVTLARDPNIEAALRVRCYIELMQYLHPKRKAVDEPPPDDGFQDWLSRLSPWRSSSV